MDKPADAPASLPASARVAWRRYCEMFESKEAHFTFLSALEEKRQAGRQPTLAETARLEVLLAAHNRCVADFAAATKTLSDNDSEARDVFLRLVAELNRELGGEPSSWH